MRNHALCLSVAAVALSAGGLAFAQSEPTQLEEIIVTASKREEALSRAPMAVTAIGQEALDQGGVTQVQELVSQVPNLRPSANGFAMRGIASSNGGEQGSSTVALHFDGVYSQRPQILGLPLFDIERVEVLRGPQGTLYGRNATAGVVNIITVKPQKEFQAFGDVSYGNYGETIVRGAVNIPINDRLAVRASLVRRENDGYFDTQGTTPENYEIADQLGLRLGVKWDLTDRLTWTGSINYGGDKGTGSALTARYYTTFNDSNIADTVPGTPNAILSTGNDPRSGTGYDPVNQLDYHEAAFRSNLDWKITDNLSLNYVAGLSKWRDEGVQQILVRSSFLVDNRATANSHELDLKYDSDRVRGVVGAYYFKEKQTNAALIGSRGVVPFPYSAQQGSTTQLPRINNGINILTNSPNRTNESQALFGQLTFDVTDRLRLTGGLRYNEDEAANEHQFWQFCVYGSATAPSFSNTCTIPLGPSSDIGGLAGKWDNTSWKTVVDFDVTDDVLLYTTVGTGYRGGGVGDRNAPAAYQLFQPEDVTNYELGLRSLWLNRSVSLNLTAFLMQYKNLQVSSLVQTAAGTTALLTTNAAEAEIRGVEFEGAWQITAADKLSGFATWTDATFGSFANTANSFLTPDTGYNNFRAAIGQPPLSLPSFDFTGHHLANTPEWVVKATYSHVFNLGNAGTLTPTASVYWQSDSYLSAANFVGDKQKAYTRTDINVVWDAPGDHFTAEAFVTNLEDEDVANGYGAQWGLTYATYARPRLYGVRLGYRY